MTTFFSKTKDTYLCTVFHQHLICYMIKTCITSLALFAQKGIKLNRSGTQSTFEHQTAGPSVTPVAELTVWKVLLQTQLILKPTLAEDGCCLLIRCGLIVVQKKQLPFTGQSSRRWPTPRQMGSCGFFKTEFVKCSRATVIGSTFKTTGE